MLHSLFFKKLHVTHVTCDVCDIKRDVCDIANYLKIKNESFLQTLEIQRQVIDYESIHEKP